MIPGGYYLKARKTKDSAIAKAPPHVREIWDYLMREAFYKDGRELKRGQLLRTYRQIITDLSWHIGWRKCSYKTYHCEFAMKWLKKEGMITTRKTTRGLIITICNFDHYQTPENYESHKEKSTNATGMLQTTGTIDKEGYKKVRKNKKRPTPCPDHFPVTDQMRAYAASKKHYPNLEELTEDFLQRNRAKGEEYVNWYAAWQRWLRNDIKFNGKVDNRSLAQKMRDGDL